MLFVIFEKFGLLSGWALGALFVFIRYAFFAGFTFSIFYIIWSGSFRNFRIQHRFPNIKKIHHEVLHSLYAALVFALVGVGIYLLHQAEHTRIYQQIDLYGWTYLIASFFILTIIHDTYFYWLHRFMHHPRIFRIMHRVHHVSNNPTPWAALSFHPLEAVVEIAIIPIVVLIMPIHPLVLFAFSFWSILFNTLGHLGYEFFPKGFVTHPIGKWLNTSTHHNMHHSRSNCNYSLYYNFWDRIMGTNANDYEAFFDGVKERSEG